MTPLYQSKSSSKQKPKKQTTDGFEFLKPSSIGKAVVESVAQPINFSEYLGFKKSSTEHGGGHGKKVDMKPGVPYFPKEAQHEEAAPAPRAVEAPMNYHREILHAGESKKESQESAQKVQMIIQELQRLSKSVKEIEKTLILQALGPTNAVKAGKYYESFFEWMLIVVQDARRKVEDSGAWLQATGSKKKGIHKEMKTNMRVAMSGERTQANNAA